MRTVFLTWQQIHAILKCIKFKTFDHCANLKRNGIQEGEIVDNNTWQFSEIVCLDQIINSHQFPVNLGIGDTLYIWKPSGFSKYTTGGGIIVPKYPLCFHFCLNSSFECFIAGGMPNFAYIAEFWLILPVLPYFAYFASFPYHFQSYPFRYLKKFQHFQYYLFSVSAGFS